MGRCRVGVGDLAGWRSVVLENDAVRVVVLPDKGAEIHQITDLRSGTNLLFEAPWGLAHLAPRRSRGSGDDEFMWNYAGGWQELFPSVNEACVYRGSPIPFHGEVASLPWAYEIVDGDRSEARVRFSTRSRQTLSGRARPPTARRRTGAPGRGVGEERIDAERALRVGSSLCRRAAVSRAGLPAGHPRSDDRHVTRALGARTARLEPGRREPWPWGPLRAGGTVDLRDVPGPETGSHDDLYVTDLDEVARGVEPAAGADVSARLGPRGVRLDRPLAALRRRSCASSHRVVCARHRTLDEQAQPRTGRGGGCGDRAREAPSTTSLRARLLYA